MDGTSEQYSEIEAIVIFNIQITNEHYIINLHDVFEWLFECIAKDTCKQQLTIEKHTGSWSLVTRQRYLATFFNTPYIKQP